MKCKVFNCDSEASELYEFRKGYCERCSEEALFMKPQLKRMMKMISAILWLQDLKLRFRMGWACIRGRSVCYRMRISPRGLEAKTNNSFIVENHLMGFNSEHESLA